MLRCYRTISFQADLTLANAHARIYRRVDAMKNEKYTVFESEIEGLWSHVHGRALGAWKEELLATGAGIKREARPVIVNWNRRYECHKGLRLTYRVTQIIPGRGCFG